jgi:uracil phosphoribosyltransferase
MQRTETHPREGNLKLRIMHYPRPSAPAKMRAAAEEYERKFGIRLDTLTYFSKALLEELHRLDEGAEVPHNITIASRTDASILEDMATLTRIANGGRLTTAERTDYFLALKRIYGKLPARLGEASQDRDALFVGIEREGRILAESMSLLPANHNLHPHAKRIPYLHGLLVGVSELPQPRTYSRCIVIDGAIASGATLISVIEKLRGACSSFSIYSAHSSLEGLLGIARYGDASGLDVSVTVGHATAGMNAKFYAVDPADKSKVVIGDVGDTISNLEG